MNYNGQVAADNRDIGRRTTPIIDVGAAQAHEILRENFTDRYILTGGISKLAHSLPYDPTNPLCDFDRTSWPYQPFKRTPHGHMLADFILKKVHGMSGTEIQASFGQAFDERAEEIMETAKESPLVIVSDHRPNLQCALGGFVASKSLAKFSSKDPFTRQKRLQDMFQMSHIIGTRALAQVIIGRPDMSPKIPFLRIGQTIFNPHLSLHRSDQMQDSLDEGFIKPYNRRFAQDCLDAVANTPNNPLGINTIWSMSPSGGPDREDLEGDFSGKKVIRRVNSATTRLINDMGASVLPVYTSFDFKCPGVAIVKLGEIIKPNQVSQDSLHSFMETQAEFRRSNGEEKVVYEGRQPASLLS